MAPDLTLAAACERLLSALGTGMLHGIVLTAAAALALRGLRRANAALRHALLMATLLVVAALPAVHALIGFLPDTVPAPEVVPADGSPAVAPALPVPAQFPGSPARLSFLGLENGPARPSAEGTEPAAGLAEPGISVAIPDLPEDEESAAAPEVILAPLEEPAVPQTPAPVPGAPWGWNVPLPAWLGISLTGAWMVLALVRLVRLAVQCRVLVRWKREGLPAPARLAAAFETLRRQVALRRPVTLRVSPSTTSPIAVGFRHPAVLIPEVPDDTDAAPGAEWNGILHHELAHLRRGDDWMNLIQQVVAAVFFFHPAILWLSRRITVEREIACDDHVLAARVPRREYALVLTDFARRTRGPSWSAAPAVWSNPSQLKERIHMILDTHRDTSPGIARGRAGAGLAALTLAALVTLVAAPRLTVARTSPAGESAPAVAVPDSDQGPGPALEPEPELDPAHAPALVATGPARENPVTIAATGSSAVITAHDGGIYVVSGEGKPKTKSIQYAQPAPPAPPGPPPVTPRVPVAAVHPGHPAPDVIEAVPTPPAPPNPPAPPMEGDLESRLQRLEQLVERLVRLEGRPAPARSLDGKPKDAPRPRERSADLALAKEKQRIDALAKLKTTADQEEAIVRGLQAASKQVEAAVRQAEEAANAATRGLKADDLRRHSMDARREALNAHRRELQKQIHDLERELERVEAQVDRAEAEWNRHAESLEAESSIEAKTEVRKRKVKAADAGEDSVANPNATPSPSPSPSTAPAR